MPGEYLNNEHHVMKIIERTIFDPKHGSGALKGHRPKKGKKNIFDGKTMFNLWGIPMGFPTN